MKKIMIAVVAIAMTIGANAAIVNWNSGALGANATGTNITAANMVTAYLWEISQTQFNDYAAMDGATLSKTIGLAYEAGTLGDAENFKANTYSAKAGAVANIAGKTAHSAGDTAYGLILYVDEQNAGWYKANVASATFTSAQNASIAGLATDLHGSAASAGAAEWAQAVPEPTSGLLLLLGMAGLALRRRRA